MSEQAQNTAPPAEPAAAAPTTGAEGDAPAGPSKSELKKRAKEAEKARKAAEREAKEEEERQKRAAADAVDNAVQNYGKSPLHQSQERTGRARLKFENLGKEDVGKEVIFRARLHNMRPQGESATEARRCCGPRKKADEIGAKIVFLQFRQQTQTLQGVMVVSGEKDEHQVSKQMLKFAQGITVRLHLAVQICVAEIQSDNAVRVTGHCRGCDQGGRGQVVHHPDLRSRDPQALHQCRSWRSTILDGRCIQA